MHSLLKGLNYFIGSGGQRRFLIISLTLRLVPFLTLPIISRLYSPSDFGLYAVYYGAIAIGGPLFAMQAHQRVCLERSSVIPSLIVASHLSAGIFFLITCSILIVINIIFQINDLVPYFLATLTSLFSASYFVTYNLMLRNEEFQMIGTRNVILAISVPVLQIMFSFLLNSHLGLILANLLSFMVLSIHGAIYALKSNPRNFKRIFKLSYSLLAIRKSIRFSSSITISGAVNSMAIHAPIFFVERFFGGYQAGVLAMAFKLGQFPFDALGNYVQDLFKSKIKNRENHMSIFDSFKLMSSITFIVYSFIAIGVSVVLPFVIPVLLGKEWAAVSEILALVMTMLLVRYAVSPFSYILLAANKLSFNFYWQIGLLITTTLALSLSIFIDSLNLVLSILLVGITFSYATLFLKSYREAKLLK
ncbi:oligosaccharide flippase family protein [Reinekea forsetii]|nr:oligosaccharide flippase family protein [Reinekea forsetii]